MAKRRKKMTTATKKKISRALKGRKVSRKTRAKISRALKKR